MTFVLPIETKSTANLREHPHAKAKRVAMQRSVASHSTRAYEPNPPMPCVVVLTRCAPRVLDDDNLSGALKSCRDGVADGLGLSDDRDPRVTWHTTQAKQKGEPTVLVRVRPRAACDDAFDAALRAVLAE